MSPGEVRPPAVAGSFYPGQAYELRQVVSAYLKAAGSPGQKPTAGETPGGKLRALAVPHAGYIYSGAVAARGFQLLTHQKWNRIHLWGPSHRMAFRGLGGGGYLRWATPLGEVATGESQPRLLPEAHTQEHCLEVELPFLQTLDRKETVLPLLFGQVNPETALEQITVADEDLVVVSTDLSHYHPYDEAVRRDKALLDRVVAGDWAGAEGGEACGLVPLLSLMHLARHRGWECRLIDYQNSGDTAGDRKAVVGYAALAWMESGND